MSVGLEGSAGPSGASKEVAAWEDDPGPPDAPNTPVSHPAPDLAAAPFPCAISIPAPSEDADPTTPGFRYWAAADALRRAADFWGGICPEPAWHPTVGPKLTTHLDEGEELNAYYDREGLRFFHEGVGGHVFYSGESPDVVCHELGHAVLDSVRPELWDVHSAEPPALHEAFGDMSAMLSALQLPALREDVIAATSGRIGRSSRVSRLAEQLGWAIRQGNPDAVDRDSLRNAANSFFYRDPLGLPPSAPASALSSEPHSFSRVFTGAFLSSLAGMFAAQPTHDSAALEQVANDAGKLLIAAAKETPVVVAYFSQFAAHMLAADQAQSGGQYSEALRAGFVKHGILSLSDATSPLASQPAPKRVMGMTAELGRPASPRAEAVLSEPRVESLSLSGHEYGLDENLLVRVPTQAKRFNVAGAHPSGGSTPDRTAEEAAADYVGDVFRRGHVAIDPDIRTGREVVSGRRRATHELRREDDSIVLARLLFECGICA
jgi:hypothetical protein